MDTSEQYIRMCEKATEIQEQIPDATHVTWLATIPITGFHLENVFASSSDMVIDKFIWLPRQGQLQKMLLTTERDFIELLADFYWHWAAYKTDETYPWRSLVHPEDMIRIRKDFTSMEQLCLAFAMKEKYSKVWNGKDWVR